MKTHCNSRFGHCFLRAIISIAGGALAVMLLWNWLLPPLFSLHEISYLQAGGLLILARLLFGGFHRRHGHCQHCSHEHQGNLTPEEREQLKARFREKWFGCKSSSSSAPEKQQ